MPATALPCAMLNALVSDFARGLPREYAEALNSQLQDANEAEVEAFWWAQAASSNRHLLLYLLQTLPTRLLRGQVERFPRLYEAREECKSNQSSLERLRDERAELLGHLLLARSLNTAHTANLSTQTTVSIANHRRPSQIALLWPKVFFNTLLVYSSYSLLRYGYSQRYVIRQWLSEGQEAMQGLIRDWVLEPVKEVWNTVRASDEAREGLISAEGVLADMESLERMALSLAKDVLHYTEPQLLALRAQVRSGDLTPLMEIYEADIRSPFKSAIGGSLIRNILIQTQKAKVDIDQALKGIDKLLRSQELTFAFVGVAPALFLLYFVSKGGAYATRLAWSGTKAFVTGVGNGVGGILDGGCKLANAFGVKTGPVLSLLQSVGNDGNDEGSLLTRRGEDGTRITKRQAWADLRRVERLLIRGGADTRGKTGSLTPLSTGLAFLSTARLREYAVSLSSSNFSPGASSSFRIGELVARVGLGVSLGTGAASNAGIGSPLRTGGIASALDRRTAFLEDISDLADPLLAREDKLRVVDRMWRCWGGVYL
ncbi:ATP synthase regulation protein NCA2-domain-containing protein [Coprinopsis sp. MPI-PUGE-AT-0042]|nr:ATP synthase regulation protein NCA2-domain-containing protein [Coprinopsis sp. MPI-PUGE-AT-0042]